MPSPIFNDPEYVKRQYKDSAKVDARLSLHQRFSVNPYHWHPFVFDHLDLPPCCRILELGCGPGTLWEENLVRIPPGWEIILSDSSAGMLEKTRRRLEPLRAFQFKVIDAQSIPYEDGSFEAVIANHMLYHVPDLSAALSEIRRVLKPGGRFFAATNGDRHMVELAELLVRFDPKMAGWAQNCLPFRLENGQAELAPFFTDIHLYRYEDALEIPEAAPLMDYILSTSAAAVIGERLDMFRQFLSEEMAARGGRFHITKAAGLFVSVRKED